MHSISNLSLMLSANGVNVTKAGLLPTGFQYAWQFAFVCKFTQAEAAETKLAVVCARTATDAATVLQLNCWKFASSSLLNALFLFDNHGCLSQGVKLLFPFCFK
jgi:hypothetical protein